MVFQIRRGSIVRPFLAIFGATAKRSFVDIGDSEIAVRFGSLFDHSVRIDNIAGVEPTKWELWGGLGVRKSRVGLAVVGSTKGVVRIKFVAPVRIKALFTFNCEELLVSLEDPDGFLREIESRISSRSASPPRA